MCYIPNITPLSNIISATKVLEDIYEYQWDYGTIGLRPYGNGSDSFSYFFAIHGIPFERYLEAFWTVDLSAIGGITAYDYNIKYLKDYINYCVTNELNLIYDAIIKIKEYRDKRLPIGKISVEGEPDYFIIFFVDRMLPIKVSLKDDIQIENSDVYLNNIETLLNYTNEVERLLIDEDER